MSNILKKVFSYMREGAPTNPTTFDDPLAEQIEWSPCAQGGTNFRTRKLVDVDGERIEFRPTMFAMFFYGLFFVIGVGVLIAGVVALFSGAGEFMGPMIMGLVGLVFASVGGGLFYFGTTPIIFDRRRKLFYKGRKRPDEVICDEQLTDATPFDQIHALQLLREFCSGNKSSYYSYELNLVLEDGRRINVIDHGHLASIREDAQKLAALLDKPVWDGI